MMAYLCYRFLLIRGVAGVGVGVVGAAIQVCKEKRRSLADPFFAMLPFLSLTICSGLWVIFNPLSMKVYGVQTVGDSSEHMSNCGTTRNRLCVA